MEIARINRCMARMLSGLWQFERTWLAAAHFFKRPPWASHNRIGYVELTPALPLARRSGAASARPAGPAVCPELTVGRRGCRPSAAPTPRPPPPFQRPLHRPARRWSHPCAQFSPVFRASFFFSFWSGRPDQNGWRQNPPPGAPCAADIPFPRSSAPVPPRRCACASRRSAACVCTRRREPARGGSAAVVDAGATPTPAPGVRHRPACVVVVVVVVTVARRPIPPTDAHRRTATLGNAPATRTGVHSRDGVGR